jgi:hypothetical protein
MLDLSETRAPRNKMAGVPADASPLAALSDLLDAIATIQRDLTALNISAELLLDLATTPTSEVQ